MKKLFWKYLRKLLIRLKVWERLYGPAEPFGFGIYIHKPWPWEKRQTLSIDEIVASNPMTSHEHKTIFEWKHAKWYDCARCDAGYNSGPLEQECTCKSKQNGIQ